MIPLVISSTGIPVLTLTLCDDFESGNVGWLSTPTGGANEWQLGNTPAFGATAPIPELNASGLT